MERLNSLVTDGAILAAVYFNMWGEILSGPQALDTSRPLSSCSTSDTVQHISSREGSCGGGEDGSIRGTVKGGWDLLKQVEKNWFSNSAFCRSLLAVRLPC